MSGWGTELASWMPKASELGMRMGEERCWIDYQFFTYGLRAIDFSLHFRPCPAT